jgi:hypothetical protein
MLLTFTNWNSVRGISSWYQKFGSTTTLRCRCLKSTRFKALHIEKMKRTLWRTFGPVHLQVVLDVVLRVLAEEEAAATKAAVEDLHRLCCGMKFIAGDSISKAVAYAGDAEETSSSL